MADGKAWQPPVEPVSVNVASESLRSLLLDLKRIDALIQQEVQRSREQHRGDEPFRGLFIAEQEIDALLTRGTCAPRFTPPASEAMRRSESEMSLTDRLSCLFDLSAFEVDCLLICVAPEFDPRYERLYSYLQDDVTKKRASVDLVLNLLCRSIESKISGRRCFAPDAKLIRNRLLRVFEDPSQPHPTLLGKYLKVDQRIVEYLIGSDQPDEQLSGYVNRFNPVTSFDELVLTFEQRKHLACFVQDAERGQKEAGRTVLYLQGPYGSGKRSVAEAVCRSLGVDLLVLDGKRLARATEADLRPLVELAIREARLQPAALYVRGFDAFLQEDKAPLLSVLLDAINTHREITFLAGEAVWEPANELPDKRYYRFELGRPLFSERLALWRRFMQENSSLDLAGPAERFRFTPGQIRDAAATARNLAVWRNVEDRELTTADLHEACRLQCNRKLSTLARKVKPHFDWDDIILPADRVQQLREICNALKYRSLVYDQWGFDRKLSLGKGLNVLFAGPPGTGKTMAAEIMAGELGLDMYKTDLSTVVSKYIGETEKNLSRIFAEAESSNAILFFDEADALFGKRSEVRDSHDRYANIEINYLLQKMEEHEGVVILATNFRKNMDDAFVRRLHFTIDFPLPDENDRLRIWEAIWPAETPLHVDLDLQAIARRFELPGGNIRNIAMGAAFLAADNGGVVNMRHLLHATRREYQKMGKVVMHGEFEAEGSV